MTTKHLIRNGVEHIIRVDAEDEFTLAALQHTLIEEGFTICDALYLGPENIDAHTYSNLHEFMTAKLAGRLA